MLTRYWVPRCVAPSINLRMNMSDSSKSKPDTTRVQFEMPAQSFARLQSLKEKTEAVSYAEVVKNALRLYEALIAEADAGNTFLIQTADGQTRQYQIF